MKWGGDISPWFTQIVTKIEIAHPRRIALRTDMNDPNPPSRIVYILEEFPKLSESFVIEEVKALHAKGVIAEIYSISRPKHLSDRHPELLSLTRYPRTAQTLKTNLILIFSFWYWTWFFRTLRQYPTKLFAFFRTMSFLPAIRSAEPDHIHTHFSTFASYMTMILSERSRIPYSLTVHATGIFQEKKLIYEKCINAGFVVAISNFNRNYLAANFNVPLEKIEVVHCGILPSRFNELIQEREKRGGRWREEKGRMEQEDEEGPELRADVGIRILSIGRLVEKKGFPVLLEALDRLMEGEGKKGGEQKEGEKREGEKKAVEKMEGETRGVGEWEGEKKESRKMEGEKSGGEKKETREHQREEGDLWELAIAGDGPLRPLLEESIREKGLEDRVSLLGRVSGSQLLEELTRADIFVLPCVESSNGDIDGIPVVLMEALYCGIPTITTKISGIPELVVHKETGLLVTPGSAVELSEAITYLMNHPDEVVQCAQNGQRKVEEEFNILKTTEELHHLFGRTIR